MTLDKKEGQRQFLLVWSGLVVFFRVRHALHAVVPPLASLVTFSDLKVAAFELRDRDLLLNELEEELLLVTNAPP